MLSRLSFCEFYFNKHIHQKRGRGGANLDRRSITSNILTANDPALVALSIATMAKGEPFGIYTTNKYIMLVRKDYK